MGRITLLRRYPHCKTSLEGKGNGVFFFFFVDLGEISENVFRY